MNSEILTQKLIHFIDHLRRCGYHIGIEQFTAAQDLILALAAQGQIPMQLSRLRTLLAPILCHSPKEQAEFQYHFENWLNQLEKLTPTPVQTNSAAAVISQNQPRQEKTALERALSQIKVAIPFWRGATILFAIVLIISVVSQVANNPIVIPLKCETRSQPPISGKPKPSLPPSNGQPKPHEPTTLPSPLKNLLLERQLWFILLSPVLFFLLWQLWWQHRARLFLTRQSTTLAPDIKQLFVETIDDNLFQSMSLSRTAQQLRRHIPLAIQQLNITATIDKTIQAGGWFTPVMGTIPASPEYLVLVDRTTFKDHQTQLMNSLINRLIQQDVFITHYYFDTDPRRCYPPANTLAPLTLTELAERYPRHRLMIFSTSTGFINPITGRLVDWIEQLSIWSPRVLLTLESPAQWGYQEQLLINADFLVLAANETGLTRLAEQINTPTWSPIHHPFDFSTSSVSFPELLSERPRRWLERHAPDSKVLTELLQQVQYFLGKKGYYWFSACAVYPELHWQLTLYLGHNLHLLTEERLAKLARLPWFRYGYMPNWLRERLIADLSLAQEREIRTALQVLLITALEKPLSKFHLEIAQPQKSILAIFARQLLPKLAKQATKRSPLRDYTFLTFVADKLSLKIPKILQTLFIQQNSYVKTRLTVLIIVLLLPILFFVVSRVTNNNIFRDRLTDGHFGPEMVWIPAGTFRMGDIQGSGYEDEQPVHEVSITRFAMSRYEITFAEYDRFAQATGRKLPNDEGWGRGDRPVINVSWDDAIAYAQWLSDQTGECYRLPTEAEWEYAARAGTETKYWWGNEIGTNHANCIGCGSQWDNKMTAPVGSFACNPFKLCDIIGNVWEWTCSEYEEKYTGKEQQCVKNDINSKKIVIRGGSWTDLDRFASVRFRHKDNYLDHFDNIGFRLVKNGGY